MRSVIIIGITLLASIGTIAQPQISKDWIPQIGDAWVQHVLVEIPEVGDSGADVTWDFTDLNENAVQFMLQFDWLDPATTPYVDSFPDATVAARFGLGGFFSYGYYSETDEDFNYWGSGSQFATAVYLDPQTFAHIGLEYGAAVVDTFESVVYTTFSQPDTLEGFTSYEYDGYGTVKIGDLVIDDAIRVYQQDITYDSAVNSIIANVFIDTTQTYAWIADGSVFPVVQWQRTTTISRTYVNGELVDEDVEEPDTVFSYDPNYMGTSANDHLVRLAEFQLYPTTTSDHLNVDLGSAANFNYRVYTMDGQLINSGYVSGDSGVISVKGLSAGWHVMQVDGYLPKRFLVLEGY